MAKTKKVTFDATGKTFLTGVNLNVTADNEHGDRYEAGEAVPDDLTDAQIASLIELGAIEA